MSSWDTFGLEPRASAYDIQKSCRGADDAFVQEQLERGATIGQAQDAWIAEQASSIAEQRAIQAELQRQLANANDDDDDDDDKPARLRRLTTKWAPRYGYPS